MVEGLRREKGQQAGGFFGQLFRAFGLNLPVVNFHFNGQIIHAGKLRPVSVARKRKADSGRPEANHEIREILEKKLGTGDRRAAAKRKAERGKFLAAKRRKRRKIYHKQKLES